MAITYAPAVGSLAQVLIHGEGLPLDNWFYSAKAEPLPATAFSSGGIGEWAVGIRTCVVVISGVVDLNQNPNFSSLLRVGQSVNQEGTGFEGPALQLVVSGSNSIFASFDNAIVFQCDYSAVTPVLCRYTATLFADWVWNEFSGDPVE